MEFSLSGAGGSHLGRRRRPGWGQRALMESPTVPFVTVGGFPPSLRSSPSPGLGETATPAPMASSSEKRSPTSPNSGASALAHTQPRSDPASFRPAFPLSGVKVCLPGCESVSHGPCLTHCCFPFPAGLAQLGTWEPGNPCLWHSGIKYVSSRQGWVGSLVATSGMALLSHSRSLNSQACQAETGGPTPRVLPVLLEKEVSKVWVWREAMPCPGVERKPGSWYKGANPARLGRDMEPGTAEGHLQMDNLGLQRHPTSRLEVVISVF